MPEERYSAKHIFTGEEWLVDHAIISVDGAVKEIVPSSTAVEFDTIIPAFIDLQIYGAYGKLFSVYPESQTLSLIHKYCTSGGASWFQPTVATNTMEVFHRCIDAVKQYWDNGGPGCIGLHVEGPWISREKRGAHIESLVRVPAVEEVRSLLEYGKDVISMITIAPELCNDDVIELLRGYNVIISAGHSNATFNESSTAFDRGFTAVTHLYNAMSGLHHREPGMVGAAMLHDKVFASIIADGHHVDYNAIRIASQMMKDRLFLITDAVTDTSEGAYPHQLEDDKYVASGILSGSALTMMQAVKNVIAFAGIEKTNAIKMACTIPGKVMKKEKSIGRIIPGASANFIATDSNLTTLHMIG